MNVYKTTYDVLVGLCKLIDPISPFISDGIYINLTNIINAKNICNFILP